MKCPLLDNYRAWRERRNKIDPTTTAAIVLAATALAIAAGTFRWTWLLMDEQIQLRQEFMNLKSSQDQLNIQFEFWNQQLQKERSEIQKLKDGASSE